MVRTCLPVQERQVQSLGWEDPLEKEMAIHSSILAWKIPWTEELGGLQSMGSQKVRSILYSAAPHTEEKTEIRPMTLRSCNQIVAETEREPSSPENKGEI